MTRADRFATLQAQRAAQLEATLERILPLRGDERVLDVGTGTGALAHAVAARAGSVVALDADATLVERASHRAPANVEHVVGDGERLPFEGESFDVSATLRTLHHTSHPDRLVAELARVTRPGGTVLVADQVAPDGAIRAAELNRFERARDGSTTRVLTASELRRLLAACGLDPLYEEAIAERRELEAYLDLAGCAGEARERARALAPAGYEAVVAWCVLRRP